MAHSAGHIMAFATLIAAGLVGVVAMPSAARWDIGDRGMSIFGSGARATADGWTGTPARAH